MKPEQIKKYRPITTVRLPDREWPDRAITEAPVWASVDLRDGNQSLPVPMNIEEKLEYFDMLVNIGFKQIEVGFPSASDTEFNFLRRLIDEEHVPEDVTVQVLVQAREHLIRRTFTALHGAKSAIVHLYNSTSPLQRKVTFSDASKEKILDIAVEGTKLVKSLIDTLPGTDLTLQYSPESFSDTETEYALEVCEAVMDAWGATSENKVIINLPATVEWFTPNLHADQIEWFCRNMKQREAAIISLHTHNDRNLDIVTVALNMNSHGIDTGLDFSGLASIREIYERTTRMIVPDRQPYSGELVFTAFSGSHQDAIKKGMDRREADMLDDPDTKWGVPYLTIDPQDLGRSYEAIIRINSQSEHGYDLPKTMHPQVGLKISSIADENGSELSVDEIKAAFFEHFVELKTPLELVDFEIDHQQGDRGDLAVIADVIYKGEQMKIQGIGNGPINALVNAIDHAGWKNFKLTDYRSHAVRGGSDADSAAYVQLQCADSKALVWGAGVDPSIGFAGMYAFVSAYNLLQN